MKERCDEFFSLYHHLNIGKLWTLGTHVFFTSWQWDEKVVLKLRLLPGMLDVFFQKKKKNPKQKKP